MQKKYLVLIIILILVVGGVFFTYEQYIYVDPHKFDIGTSDNHNDIWELTNLSTSSLTRTLDCSIFSKDTDHSDRLRTKIPVNSNVQFDLLQVDGLVHNYPFSFEKTNNEYLNGNGLELINGSLNKWYHISINVYSDHYVIHGNNVTKTVNYSNVDGSTVYFGFWTPHQMHTLKFKNFEVNPINSTM
ncbi:hypothetical protein [uncultured Methanobrevibacter sp.]|uniref:hypothetical protein n=1 Tax=uncultured Methanobrevibacter sp. TaxID=253161 RepID=UPI0025F93D94|nr:hypothetical protein [uncultured Methanobrevibacter sp.]